MSQNPEYKRSRLQGRRRFPHQHRHLPARQSASPQRTGAEPRLRPATDLDHFPERAAPTSKAREVREATKTRNPPTISRRTTMTMERISKISSDLLSKCCL